MSTRILVVDDSSTDRAIVKSALKDEASSIEAVFATDGVAALDMMAETLPTLVITDMQMPKLDGLELVQAIRHNYPTVPVILITGNGSEGLAVSALREGAASYVPKSSVQKDLMPTVMRVLANTRANRELDRMHECWANCQCEFQLPNDPNLVTPLVGQIGEFVAAMRLLDETGQIQLAMALEEAIVNAMYHGNLELTYDELESIGYDLFDDSKHVAEHRRTVAPYKDRFVTVKATLTKTELRIVVRDDGPGFDHDSVPSPAEMIASSLKSGRGLTHMRVFSDEMMFNDQGNEVTMIKRKLD